MPNTTWFQVFQIGTDTKQVVIYLLAMVIKNKKLVAHSWSMVTSLSPMGN